MKVVCVLVLAVACVASANPTFTERSRLIEEHNARYELGLEKYRMAHNKFSYMTKSQLRRFTGELAEDVETNVTMPAGIVDDLDGQTPPASKDYRKFCSPIRDQDTCGSCYAFASAAAMEVHLRVKQGLHEDVSEQDIVDCSTLLYGNKGCEGGNTMKAFKYIAENGFVTKRDVYPYENAVGRCRSQRRHSAGTVEGYELVYGGKDIKEDKMKVIVGLDGPVTIMLQYMPESFYLYSGGIYDDPACGKIDPENPQAHAVTIVGYGSEKGENYWIVRNSWGAKWGENGYVRFAFGKNICALTTKVVLPVVKAKKSAPSLALASSN